MSIIFNKDDKKFSIQLPNSSYFLEIDEEGALRNLYWGKKIDRPTDTMLEVLVSNSSFSRTYPYREEYIARGKTSFDEPCILPEFSDGTRDTRLIYKSHSITKFDDGELLSILMEDEFYPFMVELRYRIYDGLDLISKNAVITNNGSDSVKLTRMKSGTMYTHWGRPMRLMYFSGRWGREYQKEYIDLRKGRFVIDNRRGTCTGPNFVPFYALDEGCTTETSGDVWYGTLHWSGNFKIEFEQPYTNQVCVTAGVNDFDCEIVLKAGEYFETPLFTIGYSDGGYEKMSETLYDFQFDFLAPQNKVHNIFPIIYNSWYPYEMNVNEEKCLSFLDKVKEVGAELFVIDDGWFKGRTSQLSSLGDWEVDKEKFPNGLKPISDKAHGMGLLFGLWIEPEMVNENSDLFKKHPEWILHYPNRSRTKFTHQCVLNLAREDVKEFVFNAVDTIISEYNLDYVKWDMNSYFSEVGDPEYNGNQKEIWIRYTQNLLDVWKKLNEKYPKVLFECCAHGGARSDYGMAQFSDRINRSDNADPIDVLKLHEGFSTYLLPKLAGGAGNISPSPNGINGRIVPLKFRAFLGMTGSMSVGINLLKAPAEEIVEIKNYLDEYKKIRDITQNAYVYRLASAFDNSYTVWEYLKRDKSAAVIFVFAHGMNFRDVPPRMRLRGLDNDKMYKVSGVEHYFKDEYREEIPEYTSKGDALMNFGIQVEPRGDYDCQIIKIEEV